MAGIEYVSASSITLFQECQRKWYYRYILGHKGETSAAMERGTQVHAQLERYLEGGGLPDTTDLAGQVAFQGISLLPRLDLVKGVELSLEDYPLSEPLGVPFKGFIDLVARTESNDLHILDHKTTSDLKYAKTPEELSRNTQLVIYAKHILDQHPYEDRILLTHVYYTTRKPFGAKRVDVLVSREHIEEQFAAIAGVVDKMVSASELSKEHTTTNSGYCRAYNKLCDHYNDCFFTTERREVRPMSERKEKLLAFLRAEAPAPEAIEIVAENKGAVGSSSEGAVGSRSEGAVGSSSEGAVGSVYLYINVNPLKGSAVRPLVEALQPHIDTVCAEYKVAHVAQAPYGAGWSRLAQLVMENGIASGHWYTDQMSSYYSKLSDELFSKADYVYSRG